MLIFYISGDENFDFTIAESVPNNGSYTFIVLAIPTNSARLMVDQMIIYFLILIMEK